MNGQLRIAIIGAGTAGAATALFLARAQHDVTVFERVLDPGPVGAGIMMQPSGLLVLEQLGLASRILSRGSRVDHLVCQTSRGRTFLDLRYDMLGAGLYGVGLHRGVLFETLYGALTESAARVVCGVAIERLRRTAHDGVAVLDREGTSHGTFDLAVVADGARSHVRDSMAALTRTVRPYPWGALWFIGKAPDERYEGRLHQIVRGARQMVGFLPTGLGPGEGDARLVSFFVSTRSDALDAVRGRGLGAWKKRVLALSPLAAPIIEQIHDFDQLTFAGYYDVALPRWHSLVPRAAILGDAAHATSPQLGQGCNLALADAAALAKAILEQPTVSDALEAYTESRTDHLGFYQFATRALTPFFQSDYNVLGLARDLFMGAASQFSFVRREMVRSMAGTKTGLLWGAMETRMPRG